MSQNMKVKKDDKSNRTSSDISFYNEKEMVQSRALVLGTKKAIPFI